MSIVALSPAVRPRIVARRIGAAARVLLTAAPLLAGWPLGIMASSFVINVLLFAAIRDASDDPTTGGLASIYVLQMIVCWQLLHQYFSYAVGMNVSRRAYFAGVVLVAFAQSVLFGIFLYVCAVIERGTAGWGVDVSFFAPLSLMRGPWYEAIAVYTVPMIVLSCVGFFLGAVSKRWGGNGILALTVLFIVIGGGAAILISYADAWPSVGRWLADRSWLSITAGWSLIPAALAAACAWLVLRRAVP